ncbi:DUF1501 domain-containing protein [Gaetbulibacter aestuarii]|uniref:DUF1501 domain-containing protein n=1 Tax=Gaetbulibacter aestuarii TaxID=1502358 RepID=A0ABW7MVD7_9FLAO
MERRKFLKQSSLASSLFFVPGFIRAFEDVVTKTSRYKRLVIVQLSGGNDGLNTVVPYQNDLYYKNRPTLGIPKSQILSLNDEIGLNHNLVPLKNLYDQGYLTIINNVGYPNPVRSHFRSMDIWQTASDANKYLQTGWIGRFLDAYGKHPYDAIEIDDSLSLAMKGEGLNGIATQNPKSLFNLTRDPYFKHLKAVQEDAHLSEHNLGYLYKTMIAAQSSAKYIYETSNTVAANNDYPNNAFAKQLRTTAQFINSNLETRVFYTALNGFDTHANQKNRQNRLLKTYSESVMAFVDDLKMNGTFKDTLILTFSEFGRRVQQNASTGTDHGTANNIFIIGENLKQQGIFNGAPNLNELDENGDLKFEIDFRNIYATLLDKWLEVDPSKVLNNTFKPLNFI